MTSHPQIAFIGGGHMAGSLMADWLRNGFNAARIHLSGLDTVQTAHHHGWHLSREPGEDQS